VGPLAIALLAALPPPLVEGRVGEVKGAPAAFATVTLAQDDRTQVVRTGADGKFRFRAFEGPATVTVKLPQGWTAKDPLSRTLEPALRGDVVRADFTASARRILRGRLLVGGAPLPNAPVNAGELLAATDAHGLFVLDGLPAGVVEVKVDAPPLRGRVELPEGPADLARDVTAAVPDFAGLGLARVPNGAAARPIADWLTGKRLSKSEVAALERLAALSALDPSFRLAMVAAGRDLPRAAQAAAMLQRYLTGPALVPRERLVFSVGEFARPGQLELLLTRLQEPR
jgi:hypothetical protein